MPKTRESSSPTIGKSRKAKTHPTREQIALRAYHFYLKRGGVSGNELEDWTRAERELLEKYSKSRGKTSPKPIAA